MDAFKLGLGGISITMLIIGANLENLLGHVILILGGVLNGVLVAD